MRLWPFDSKCPLKAGSKAQINFLHVKAFLFWYILEIFDIKAVGQGNVWVGPDSNQTILYWYESWFGLGKPNIFFMFLQT